MNIYLKKCQDSWHKSCATEQTMPCWHEYTDKVYTSPLAAIKVWWLCNFCSWLKYWSLSQNLKWLLARLDKQKMLCKVRVSVLIHVKQGTDFQWRVLTSGTKKELMYFSSNHPNDANELQIFCLFICSFIHSFLSAVPFRGRHGKSPAVIWSYPLHLLLSH